MNPSLHRALILATIAILFHSTGLSAPEAAAPAYFARARVEIVPPTGQEAEAFLRAQLPKDDPSISLKRVLNTKLFDICITSPDPNTAAKRANELAVAIRTALGSDGDVQRLKIWEKAEPPTAPVSPKEAKQ